MKMSIEAGIRDEKVLEFLQIPEVELRLASILSGWEVFGI